MSSNVVHRSIRKTSLPRTGRALDAAAGGVSSSGGATAGGSSFAGYWSLITTDKDNNPLEEAAQYIKTKYTAVSEGDVVAYATSDHDIILPHAGYNMIGAVQIKPDSGLIIDSATGMLSVDPAYAGGGEGGVDFTTGSGLQLSGKVLSVKYGVAADTVAAGNDSRILNGQKAFEVISKGTWWGQKMTDVGVVTGAMTGVTNINGKLSFVDTGVDVTDNIRATGDVVAYATADVDVSDWLSLIIDNVTIRFNEAGKLYAAGGGGQAGIAGITVSGSGNAITSVALSADKTSLTFTKGSTFALKSEIPIIPSSLKNPYSLSWSGYSSGSYDGSSSKSFSIPSNTNQLTNGAGFITGINQTMILNALTGAGSSSKYLAGNGTFYTIAYSELSGTPDLSIYVKLAGAQTISGSKHFTPGLSSGNKSDVWIQLSSGNSINGMYQSSVSNLYLNYISSSKYVRIDGNCNLMASGDVVAYATGSSDIVLPTASPSSYGAVKYDNSTIKMNSSGQLYCTISGGGGSSVSVIDNLTSTSTTSALSANQGRLLDSRLQAVKFGSNYTDYVVTQLGSTSYNLSKNGHAHAWSAITSKPSWIGSSKPSYTWSEITSKPSILSSISYSTSGSGSVVTNVTASGSTVYVTKGNVSGSSFNGGTITTNITISRSDPGLALSGSSPFINFGSYWKLNTYSSDFRFYYGNETRAYLSYASAGNMWIKGSLVQGSDIRLKNRMDDITGVLNKIKGIDVFRYTRKDATDGMRHIGVSAQQVLGMFPEFVDLSGRYYAVNYAGLATCVAIQGLKELMKLVEDQKREINELKQLLNRNAA